MSAAYDREQYVSLFPLHPIPAHPSPHHTTPPPSNPPLSKLQPNRQNNSRLSELSSKVSALRGVTVDIYDNARDQHVIDNSVRPSPSIPTLHLTSLSTPTFFLLSTTR